MGSLSKLEISDHTAEKRKVSLKFDTDADIDPDGISTGHDGAFSWDLVVLPDAWSFFPPLDATIKRSYLVLSHLCA